MVERYYLGRRAKLMYAIGRADMGWCSLILVHTYVRTILEGDRKKKDVWCCVCAAFSSQLQWSLDKSNTSVRGRKICRPFGTLFRIIIQKKLLDMLF